MSQPPPPLPALPPSPTPGVVPPAANEPMRRVELVISNLLRIGVAVSLLLVTVGTIISFVRHPEYMNSPAALATLTGPGAAPFNSVAGLMAALGEWHGQSVVALGLLVLIATPMMRVAVSIVAFFLERDWAYTLITSSVFCLLLLALVLGAAE